MTTKTMTRACAGEVLCRLAAKLGGVNAEDVTLEMHLVNDLNFDSLEGLEFIMEIEDEFEVSIPDEQAERVKTVGQALELVMPLLH